MLPGSRTQFDKLMRGAPPLLLVELIVLAGLYHAVSFATNAIGVQNEAFAPGFPKRSD